MFADPVSGMLGSMAVSEARRRDLYNGLDELLGTERADTLMTYLPAYETIEVATKDDIRRLEASDHLERHRLGAPRRWS